MLLTKADVRKIAALARIRLTEKEEETMAEDLGAILGYVKKLNQVNTDGVEPIAQATGLENVFRRDNASLPAGELTEKLTGQFPNRKENYLKVKQVFPAERDF